MFTNHSQEPSPADLGGCVVIVRQHVGISCQLATIDTSLLTQLYTTKLSSALHIWHSLHSWTKGDGIKKF